MQNGRVLLLAGCLVLLVATTISADDKRDGLCSPDCPAGQDGKIPKRSSQPLVCRPCKPGSFKNATTNCCQECEGLLTFDAAGVPNCRPCPAGSRAFFDKATNISSCWCKDGFQASAAPTLPTSGVPGCVACPAGTFNPNRTQSEAACLPCPAATVAPKNGSERCIPCSQALNGSVAVNSTSCLCPVGTFVKAPAPKRGGGRGGRNRMLLKESEKPEGPGKGPGDDDLFKKGSHCIACNTTGDNGVNNLWPACCATGTAWNGTACVV